MLYFDNRQTDQLFAVPFDAKSIAGNYRLLASQAQSPALREAYLRASETASAGPSPNRQPA